ncbi:MAG: hypothetical protein ACI9YE_003027 [Psychroserpens sp.]
MKKLSYKQRRIDLRRCLHDRQVKKTKKSKRKSSNTEDDNWKEVNSWIDELRVKGRIVLGQPQKRKIVVYLPENLNFKEDYEQTALHLKVIRKLANGHKLGNKAYKLSSVNFDNLKKASTSASLVLTAEISKWEDVVNRNLIPNIQEWHPSIVKQFLEVGFFELFKNQPDLTGISSSSKLSLVKYIKGQCGDAKKARILKQSLENIIGDNITKWLFLRGGLDEAVTNVSHHAYPENKFKNAEKIWYLTGSLNKSTNELKIVFYDQGSGIPKTLSVSKLWEQVLDIVKVLPIAERKLDSTLIKAAVKVDRTSTAKTDRGKGLQDMLEFIKQRGEGYLSILSQKGLYKFSIKDGKMRDKSESFYQPILGTLIIWSVTLEG